ncbi:hypothetical protein [Methylobacterium bullatum]|uniref:hypothetical protein n=1 Tax=Methylobacterium bullatum TaxID=570505 RepID=UPI0037CB971C
MREYIMNIGRSGTPVRSMKSHRDGVDARHALAGQRQDDELVDLALGQEHEVGGGVEEPVAQPALEQHRAEPHPRARMEEKGEDGHRDRVADEIVERPGLGIATARGPERHGGGGAKSHRKRHHGGRGGVAAESVVHLDEELDLAPQRHLDHDDREIAGQGDHVAEQQDVEGQREAEHDRQGEPETGIVDGEISSHRRAPAGGRAHHEGLEAEARQTADHHARRRDGGEDAHLREAQRVGENQEVDHLEREAPAGAGQELAVADQHGAVGRPCAGHEAQGREA